MLEISPEAAAVLRDLNPWWASAARLRPAPPPYRRPAVADLVERLRKRRALIEVVRGPRQVGKTTGIHQIIEDLVAAGTRGTDILFVRFDLEILRDEPAALRRIVDWYVRDVRCRPLARGAPAFVLLDEVHKLRRWSDEVKHLGDTFPVRLLLTGSSSVLVARGGRESLTGRTFTTELPPFSFREVLEAWHPRLAGLLPPRVRFRDAFAGALREWASAFAKVEARHRAAMRIVLERYYQRGGYPRLHSGEIDDGRWADYLVQTVFESVLGADIPDLFPVEQPRLLRALYLEVARRTAQELAQNALTQALNTRGFATHQPTVRRYLQYLGDALLVREFRRYPLARKAATRVPAKIALTDLGVRNAILRGSPSLWRSDPVLLGPLVETMVQTHVHDTNMQVHFFRDHEDPADRHSPIREVDFVAEAVDGTVMPIEVKFRKRIGRSDYDGLRCFRSRFGGALGVMVTRDMLAWDDELRVLALPLESFLLAF